MSMEVDLLDQAYGSAEDGVYELEQMWNFDGDVLVVIRIKFDLMAWDGSKATATVIDGETGAEAFTIRDFPSRWWKTLASEVPSSDTPPKELLAVAGSLIERMTNILDDED